MNEFKDIPILLQILVAINSCGILYVVFYFGKLVQKQEDHEKRLLVLESQNMDVEIATLATSVSSLVEKITSIHQGLHDVRNLLMGKTLS